MKAFKATYTPWDEARNEEEEHEFTVLIVKICEPESGEDPNVVYIGSNGELAMDTMDCFTDCRWGEGIKVVGNIYENK